MEDKMKITIPEDEKDGMRHFLREITMRKQGHRSVIKFASDMRSLGLKVNGYIDEAVETIIKEDRKSIPDQILIREYLQILGHEYEVDKEQALEYLEWWRHPALNTELTDMEDQSERERGMCYFVSSASSMIRTNMLSKDMEELEKKGEKGALSDEDKLFARANLRYWRHCHTGSYLRLAKGMNDLGMRHRISVLDLERAKSDLKKLKESKSFAGMASIYNSLQHMSVRRMR